LCCRKENEGGFELTGPRKVLATLWGKGAAVAQTESFKRKAGKRKKSLEDGVSGAWGDAIPPSPPEKGAVKKLAIQPGT